MRASMAGRLKWLCRRGSLELDIMLTRYLDQCYDPAPDCEKLAFERLLTLEDYELQRFLMGQEAPSDSTLTQVVHAIRSINTDRSRAF